MTKRSFVSNIRDSKFFHKEIYLQLSCVCNFAFFTHFMGNFMSNLYD